MRAPFLPVKSGEHRGRFREDRGAASGFPDRDFVGNVGFSDGAAAGVFLDVHDGYAPWGMGWCALILDCLLAREWMLRAKKNPGASWVCYRVNKLFVCETIV